MTLMRFFLQAMCSGVKPFCAKDNRVSQSMQPEFSHRVRLSGSLPATAIMTYFKSMYMVCNVPITHQPQKEYVQLKGFLT